MIVERPRIRRGRHWRESCGSDLSSELLAGLGAAVRFCVDATARAVTVAAKDADTGMLNGVLPSIELECFVKGTEPGGIVEAVVAYREMQLFW